MSASPILVVELAHKACTKEADFIDKARSGSRDILKLIRLGATIKVYLHRSKFNFQCILVEAEGIGVLIKVDWLKDSIPASIGECQVELLLQVLRAI